MANAFEAVIGLEVHCQLSTESKIFCGCPARMVSGVSVGEIRNNANTCPICAGHPGTLPVLNRKVVEYAVKAGLATGCEIRAKNVFARKNYFYPDLPKGYQISQFERPICEKGILRIEVSQGVRHIRIDRIHMEEDAGKNQHMSGYSLVNLNRAGVPLIEIVSAPDMRTSEEAGAYLRALYSIVTYLGICDGNLQEGNFRCDANVSIRPRGATQLGTRVEIKNVNSFRFIEKAIEYEIARQIEVVQAGGRVVQETRGYDSARNLTTVMRSKEEAMDYRYFPDPDLIDVQVDAAWVESLRRALPELPEQRRSRYMAEMALGTYDASVLTALKSTAEFFEATVELLVSQGMEQKQAGKPAANWITGELSRLANDQAIEIHQGRVTPAHIADVVRLTHSQAISSTGAKQLIAAVWKTGDDVQSVVDREGLRQVSDLAALDAVIDQLILAHPAQVAEFRAGKEKLIGFFVGQVMKGTGGKANPGLLQDMIRKKLLP